MKSGILRIHKPIGPSSFDMIRQLQRRFRDLGQGVPKMGHSGTLDPAASGLLLVAVGGATKQLANMILLDKAYRATITLGVSTTTLDREGEVVRTAAVGHIVPEQIQHTLESLLGCQEYQVPLYSAIKVDGKPLYAYARAGKKPPRIPTKTMCVHDLRVETILQQAATWRIVVEVSVSKGTYIRTLAQAVGDRLGVPAHLAALERTRVGEFVLEGAKTPDEIEWDDVVHYQVES